jgi:predicted HAD superfamily Cof-like phosphohydrolase
MDTLEKVEQFHQTFGCRVAPSPQTLTPTARDEAEDLDLLIATMKTSLKFARAGAEHYQLDAFLRLALIQEELIEFAEAIQKDDIVAVLDALTDLQYVLDGSYLSTGLASVKNEAFTEVHRSNMTKEVPERDVPGQKIKKGGGYREPNLRGVLFDDSGVEAVEGMGVA